VDELVNSIISIDNGNGTYTAALCVSTIAPYDVPVCVQGGLEIVCGDSTWIQTGTGSCTQNANCIPV
jgi:hypothetical protein